MIAQPVIYLSDLTTKTKPKPFKELPKNFRSGRLAHVFADPVPQLQTDPYLLLLLADQELIEGRKEQASCLIEAAYDFFDRKNRANVHILQAVR
jgi:hypothetical protein